ncbi:MAG TPA: hypothetical protein VHG51_14745 [Longimicrobiaceae bacterium]|nr:hypothetical protein [Longimicrobiaceae bacterium]
MARTSSRFLGLLVVAAAAAYGCSDGSAIVAPEEQDPSHGLISGLLDPVIATVTGLLTDVDVLTRNTPLAQDISVTAAIGKNGGTIEIPEAGIKVIFPKNALTPPKANQTYDITVTALKGDEVAYIFQPHGLTFREPVIIMQDYKDTPAYKNPSMLSAMEGAYFPALSALDLVAATARVSEFRPTNVDVTGGKVRFTINHFSGYLIASGRSR